MPWSQPNTIWPPRVWLTRSTLRPSPRSRATSACAGTCTRWRGRSSANQRSPNARAWRLVGVRHRDHEHAPAAPAGRPRAPRRRRAREGAPASARRRRRPAAVHLGDIRLADVSRRESRSRPVAASRSRASASRSAPSPDADVEHRSRRGDPVQPPWRAGPGEGEARGPRDPRIGPRRAGTSARSELSSSSSAGTGQVVSRPAGCGNAPCRHAVRARAASDRRTRRNGRLRAPVRGRRGALYRIRRSRSQSVSVTKRPFRG